MLQPHFLGGGELSIADFAAVIEEIAKADASTAWCLSQCAVCAMAAAYLDRPAALQVFGPPDGIVAWGPVAPSEARMVEGGYRVTGSWNFASGGHQASWLGGQSFVYDPNGQQVRKPDGSPLIRMMLFPVSRRADHRRLGGDGPARHRQRHLRGQGSVRAGGAGIRPRRRGRAPRGRRVVQVQHQQSLFVRFRRRGAGRGTADAGRRDQDRRRQDARRIEARAAGQQCRAGPYRPLGSDVALGAQLSLHDRARRLAIGVERFAALSGADDRDPAGRDLDHPPGVGRSRHACITCSDRP